MILALETATNVCSVAFENSEGQLVEKRTEERGSHSENLFLFIEDLMEEQDFRISDLEAVLISDGPGSYTGLRIGASAVKGLLFQKTVPLFGISTLSSFAMQVAVETATDATIHSIIDARRKHFYYRPFNYKNDQLTATEDVQVTPIKDFETAVSEGDIIVGTGLDRLNKDVYQKVKAFGITSVTAKSLIRIYRSQKQFVHQTDPESFSPEYHTSNQVS